MNHQKEEDIIAAALRVVKEGDLSSLTIRKVKEVIKEQIEVDESRNEKLTELVKVAIDRHLKSLQDNTEETSTKKEKRSKKGGEPPIQKEANNGLTRVDEYHQLTKVCRQLGIGLPISKLKGVEREGEKIEIVKDYLRKKGVKRDPLLLTEKQLKTLRAKLEREKELESLDTNNILKDSNKRRRRGISFENTVVHTRDDNSSYSTDDEQPEEEANISSEEEDQEECSKTCKKQVIDEESDT